MTALSELGRFEIYPQGGRTNPGYWRWRYRAANGQISAVSGEGFDSKSNANRAIHDLLRDIYRQDDPHPIIVDAPE